MLSKIYLVRTEPFVTVQYTFDYAGRGMVSPFLKSLFSMIRRIYCSVCKFSPLGEIEATNMHWTSQSGFKCSHLHFSSERFSVYFHNKTSGRTISKSIGRACEASASPVQGFSFPGSCFIARQWPNPHIPTISEKLQISKKNSTNNACLPTLVCRIGNKY